MSLDFVFWKWKKTENTECTVWILNKSLPNQTTSNPSIFSWEQVYPMGDMFWFQLPFNQDKQLTIYWDCFVKKILIWDTWPRMYQLWNGTNFGNLHPYFWPELLFKVPQDWKNKTFLEVSTFLSERR